MSSRYSRDRQLEIALYAERTTDAQASAHFAVPRRSVTNIRGRWAASPELAAMRVRVVERLADQYADLEARAIGRARQALDDPETEPRDVARLLDVIAGQARLTSGAATSRAENLNVNVSPEVQAIRDLTDEERQTLRHAIDAALGQQAVDAVLADPLNVDHATVQTAIMVIEQAIEAREAGNG